MVILHTRGWGRDVLGMQRRRDLKPPAPSAGTLAGCPHPAPWHLCPSEHLDVPGLRGSFISHVPNDGVVLVIASATCRARGRFGEGKPHS